MRLIFVKIKTKLDTYFYHLQIIIFKLMKNAVIMLWLLIFTIGTLLLEAIFGCPFEWHFGEVVGGIFFVCLCTGWCIKLHRPRKKIVFSLVGGIMLIVAMEAAVNIVNLLEFIDFWKNIPALSVIFPMVLIFYIPFIFVGAIWVYLYYFCDLRYVIAKLKQDI